MNSLDLKAGDFLLALREMNASTGRIPDYQSYGTSVQSFRGVREILSYTSPDNERSQAVRAKLNLVRDPARDFMTPTPSVEQWQGLVWVVPSRA